MAVTAIVFEWLANSREFCFASLRWEDIVIFIFQVGWKDAGRLKSRGSTNFSHQKISANYPCGKLIALVIAFMWSSANKASPAAVTAICWRGRHWSPECLPNSLRQTCCRQTRAHFLVPSTARDPWATGSPTPHPCFPLKRAVLSPCHWDWAEQGVCCQPWWLSPAERQQLLGDAEAPQWGPCPESTDSLGNLTACLC